jgi:hypothetical protein
MQFFTPALNVIDELQVFRAAAFPACQYFIPANFTFFEIPAFFVGIEPAWEGIIQPI